MQSCKNRQFQKKVPVPGQSCREEVGGFQGHITVLRARIPHASHPSSSCCSPHHSPWPKFPLPSTQQQQWMHPQQAQQQQGSQPLQPLPTCHTMQPASSHQLHIFQFIYALIQFLFLAINKFIWKILVCPEKRYFHYFTLFFIAQE